jgi:Na+/H+ antiporter NhaD/arsenite permease-like protein
MLCGSALAADPTVAIPSTRDAVSQIIVGIAVIGMFVALALDKAHRTLVVATALAILFLITYFTPYRLISFETAKDAVDLNVILLLASMMALVGVLKTTNVFPWAVDRLMVQSKGNPTIAARLIIWFTGVLSAFLDNVTTVIFTFPMSSEMARRMKINLSAFLLPMVMAANIGGTATLIGDPPNVLIGGGAPMPFMEFIYNLAMPVGFMMLALVWYSERYFPNDIGKSAKVDAGEIEQSGVQLTNVPLLKWTCVIAVLIFLGFGTHTLTHMPVAVPAVIGITAILILQDYFYLKTHKPTHEERQHGILHVLEKDIEWPTLAFFLFLFALVGAAVATGLIESAATGLAWLIDRIAVALGLSKTATLLLAALIVLWFSGFLSAVIDNIPYTAVSIPIIASLIRAFDADPMGDGQILWWALALGACLGGNGTLIGASANVTVVGLAEKDGKRISFNEFTAFGARVTFITLVISSVYLVLWLYVGDVLVNVVGALLLALIIGAGLLKGRMRARA